MTTTAGDALSHVVLATILEGAICGDRRRREPARDPQCDRPAGPPGPVLAPSPMHGPMSQAQQGSIRAPTISTFVLLARILSPPTKTIFAGTFT